MDVVTQRAWLQENETIDTNIDVNYICTLVKTGPLEEYSLGWWQMKILSYGIIILYICWE